MNIFPNNFNPYMASQQSQMPWKPQPQITQGLPQPQYQTQQVQGIPCRYAQAFEQINVNEIPMDGNYAVFLKNDLSEIQIKKWNGNGGIDSISFKPAMEQCKAETTPQDNFQVISDRISALETAIGGRFDRLETAMIPKTNSRKKEAVDNE